MLGTSKGTAPTPDPRPASDQLTLFGTPTPHPVVERLKAVDANHLTPMQALELIARLAEEARQK